MKITTKMLAIALAITAFAVFGLIGDAQEYDADTSASGDEYYEASLFDTSQFETGGSIEYDSAGKVFKITGTLIYDEASDSWPLTVAISNSLWYQQSLTYVQVDGVRYQLSEDPSDSSCYFEYNMDIVWDATMNTKTISIKDNSPVTKDIRFDMTGILLQKYALDDTDTEKTILDDALDNATNYVIVTKKYTPSYNYGSAVMFGNGFALRSEKYILEVVDHYDLPSSETILTTNSLTSVQGDPVYYIYKAYDGTNTKYVIQKWNLAPIEIESIECSDDVEYNGTVQYPSLTVTDVNGNAVPASMYTAQYSIDSAAVNPKNAATYTVALTNMTNYVSDITADWTIAPYDLSIGDRIDIAGADGLVYNGSGQTVTVVLDETTSGLYSEDGNAYSITAAYTQSVPSSINPDERITGDDQVNGLAVTGSVACTHKIYFNPNAGSADNFTSGTAGPFVILEWAIAKKSIDDGFTLEWTDDGPDWTSETDLRLSGDIELELGVDYGIVYVSVDGMRTVEILTSTSYGAWKAMAIGQVNFTGSVVTEGWRAIAAPSEEEETVYIHGEYTSAMEFSENLTVIVDGDLTLKEGGNMMSKGTFIVRSGVTVTVDGGKLTIEGSAIIDGPMVSKTSDGLIVAPVGENTVDISGTITAMGDGSGTMIDSVKLTAVPPNRLITVSGNVTVSAGANAVMSSVLFQSGSKLDVHGKLTGNVAVESELLINGESYATVYLSEPEAVVKIERMEGSIAITDDGMHAYTFGGTDYYVNTVPNMYSSEDTGIAVCYDEEYGMPMAVAPNGIMLTDVRNVSVYETVSTCIVHDEASGTNSMYADTAMHVSYLELSEGIGGIEGIGDDGGEIKVLMGRTAVFDSMSMWDVGVKIEETAHVKVPGDVRVIFTSDGIGFEVEGTLDVDGRLTVEGRSIENSGTVRAAHYSEMNSDDVYTHYYTTLRDAIDRFAVNIDILGLLTVDEDVTVPESVNVSADQSIEDSVIVEKGSTLRIANGGAFVNWKGMNIRGTFIIENAGSGFISVDYDRITADYTRSEGSMRVFTSDPSYFGTLELSCSDTEWYGAGDVQVTLSITENPGISALRMKVSYDGTVMTLKSVASSGLMELTPANMSKNPCTLYLETSVLGTDVTATGLLVTLTFEMEDGIEMGTYPITVTGVESFKNDDTPVAIVIEGGSVVYTIQPGDINGDGKVDSRDSLLLRKYIARWSVTILGNPDVDGDGSVGPSDSLLLKRFLADWDVILH